MCLCYYVGKERKHLLGCIKLFIFALAMKASSQSDLVYNLLSWIELTGNWLCIFTIVFSCVQCKTAPNQSHHQLQLLPKAIFSIKKIAFLKREGRGNQYTFAVINVHGMLALEIMKNMNLIAEERGATQISVCSASWYCMSVKITERWGESWLLAVEENTHTLICMYI